MRMRYISMSYEHPHTGIAKFESLHLSELWEAVAGRIDFHLSDPRYVLAGLQLGDDAHDKLL